MKKFLIRTVLAVVVLALCLVGWSVWDVASTLNKYQPQVGDVVLQSITPGGRLLRTIRGVTESPWCHCGVVDRKDGQWVVCEAVGSGVCYTPLTEFLLRGDEIRFAVYRLKGQFQHHAAAFVACLQPYLGRPYDIQYELDDEKIYCSELVYKAYRDATGDTLGVVQRFGDLNWQPYEDDILHYHPGAVPVERQIVTPASLQYSPQLTKVCAVP